jgi:N-acetylmuramoyl-L-alanine amidase
MLMLYAIQTLLLFSSPPAFVEFNTSLSFVNDATCVMPAHADLAAPKASAGKAAKMPGKVINPPENAKKEYRLRTVVIDPGHGGHDPGCLGSFTQEKHIALAISLYLKQMINERFPEVRVIMTRETDVFIPLHERARLANRNNADLFISIHCNFFPNRENIHGSETYVMGLHTADQNLEVAKRENAVILLEADYEKIYDYDPNSTEGHIILSMFQNAFLEQSILFAEKVEAKFQHQALRRSRGVKQAGFLVLRETSMPSVLIEAGFLSNYQEEQYLSTPEGQRRIAESIAMAFAEYKVAVEQLDSPSLTPVSEPTVSDSQAQGLKNDPFAPAAALNTRPSPEKTPEKATPAKSLEQAPIANTPARPTPVGNATAPPPTQVWENTPNQQLTQRGNPPMPTRVYLDEAPAPAISFGIQLAASPNPLDTNLEKWRQIRYLVEMVRENNLYKYQARNFSNFEEVVLARSYLRDMGFPDAFIVAYKNGQRIPLDQAKRELGIP